MKTNILVFPCGSEIGLEIHNSLKFSGKIELFGASSVPNHGKFVYKRYVEGIPFGDDPAFISSIRKVVKDYKIDLIFPAHDSAVLKLSSERDIPGCKVVTSPKETCQICRSKRKTYEFFSTVLRVPKIYNKCDDDIVFPVFLKPEIGQGTRGAYAAHSHDEMEFYLKKDATLLILEYLPGKEYTVDCFTDKHGKLRFAGPRERARLFNGISMNSFPVTNVEFMKLAETINKRLKFRGAWFFQVKEAKKGELAIMEIAPRIGGTMGLTRNMGVNLPLLSVYDALDEEVEIIKNPHRVEIDRALVSRYKTDLTFSHVYIDLDDTIILNNEINPWIMVFLYQCLNKGVKLHLISWRADKSKENVLNFLIKFRIREIFDEVIDVPLDGEKHQYIKEESAVFIDDSFSERKKVSDKLMIPAFDSHEVESLVDWRY